MAQLLGQDLVQGETIMQALLELPGLTEVKVIKALRLAKVSRHKMVDDLTDKEIRRIDDHIDSPMGKVSHAHISPRKVNAVMTLIRGKQVDNAFDILKFTPKKAARIIEKVLKNAVSNASNNFELDPESLYIHKCLVEAGFTLKRIQPGPMGRAFRIRKRTSHIKIVVKDKKEATN